MGPNVGSTCQTLGQTNFGIKTWPTFGQNSMNLGQDAAPGAADSFVANLKATSELAEIAEVESDVRR